MKIKTFLDGADLEEILQHKDSDQISGFTTNPSLMRLSKAKNYINNFKQCSSSFVSQNTHGFLNFNVRRPKSSDV